MIGDVIMFLILLLIALISYGQSVWLWIPAVVLMLALLASRLYIWRLEARYRDRIQEDK